MQVTTLKSYLCEMGLSTAQFADIMECSRQHMDSVMKNKTYPSLRLSRDIFRATSGVVNIAPRPRKKKEVECME